MNKQSGGLVPLIVSVLVLAFPVIVSAATTGQGGNNYASREEGRDFIRMMSDNYGFEPGRIKAWLAQANRREDILESISRPAEKTMEWYEYRKIFIRAEQIENGHGFLQQHGSVFDQAEAEFGVSRFVIAAIIGVETRYGRYMGNHRVLDALATLAFDYPPRAGFFRKQLAEFFMLAREQGFDPTQLKGSYAGAMGYGQFIPSSYRHFAIDFDGDQIADILTNPADAIGSVANYFSRHHWKSGAPVAERLPSAGALSGSPQLLTSGLKPGLTVGDYQKAGLRPVAAVATTEPARAIQVQGEEGAELWLTYHNFYVITRYNHSHLYAMAVNELAQALQERHQRESSNEG